LSDFPAEIVPGYAVIAGNGTTIDSVSFLANTITCMDSWAYETVEGLEFTIRDNEFYGETQEENYYNQFTANGNFEFGNNIVTITSRYANTMANIAVGDVITCAPTKISANITNNSVILANVVSYGPIANGQYISARYIPEGTRVLYYYVGNSTIVMSNAATGNANSTVTYYDATYDNFSGEYVTENLYLNLYDFPPGTTITAINKNSKTITISNNSVMTANLFYIMTNDINLIVQSPIFIGGE
jgi:hypothetical protein